MACVLNPMDQAAFATAATVEHGENNRGLNSQTVARIMRISKEEQIDLIEATQKYLPSLKTKNKTRSNLEYILRAWNQMDDELNRNEMSLTEFCQYAIRIVQRQQVATLDEGINEQTTRLLAITRASNRLHQEDLRRHLTRFLETVRAGAYPDLQDQITDNPMDQTQGLTLSTIHTSKGL